MGLAVNPYAPAWKITMRSSTRASGRTTLSPSRSRGVHRQPTTVKAASSRIVDASADHQWVVPPDHLPEVARRRQLMMEPAINHQICLAAGYLAVNDLGDVDTTLTDDVAA